MKYGWGGLAALAGAALLAAGCGGGLGGKITEFSAEQVVKDGAGEVRSTAKLFVTPQKVRIEQSAPDGKQSMVIIVRKDQKLMRILMPENKTYMENPLNEEQLQKTLQSLPVNAKAKVLGTETINGFRCTKKQIETTAKIMFVETKSESTVWVSDRLDFPLRTESQNGGVSELVNIKPGGQPASLFEVPAGYEKMTNPLEIFGAGAQPKKSTR